MHCTGLEIVISCLLLGLEDKCYILLRPKQFFPNDDVRSIVNYIWTPLHCMSHWSGGTCPCSFPCHSNVQYL